MANNHEPLLTRILVQTVNGVDIDFIFNRDDFSRLNAKTLPSANSLLVELGDVLTIDGRRFKVVRMNFQLYPEMREEHNSQVLVVVEPLN